MNHSKSTISEIKKMLYKEIRIAKLASKNKIYTPKRFVEHCISTGLIAENVAKKIITNNPSLKSFIDPEVVKIAGFFHDLGKIMIGHPYHEIESAYQIFFKNKKFCVPDEKKKSVALCILGDMGVYETIGKNYPKDTLFPEFLTKELKRKIIFLQSSLANKKNRLSIEEMCSTNTIEKSILLYADLRNNNGKFLSYDERLKDVIKRYSKKNNEAGIRIILLLSTINQNVNSIMNSVEYLMLSPKKRFRLKPQ